MRRFASEQAFEAVSPQFLVRAESIGVRLPDTEVDVGEFNTGRRAVVWVLMAAATTPSVVVAAEPARPTPSFDEHTLLVAGASLQPADLITALNATSGSDGDFGRVRELAGQLGDETFTTRERAARALSLLGPAALPALREVARGDDAHAARAASDLIVAAEARQASHIPATRVRVLARVSTEAAFAALLRHLPFAENDGVEEEIYYGIDSQVARNDKLRPLLLRALNDELPARRALGACVLGRIGSADEKKQVSRLLTDRDTIVRLRAAQGLLACGDTIGLPALASLLKDAPLPIARQAEELLWYAAGDGGPETFLGKGTAAERVRCGEAWTAWVTGAGREEELKKRVLRPSRPGLVWLCESNPAWVENPPAGHDKKSNWAYRFWLTGCDGRTRYSFETTEMLSGPIRCSDDGSIVCLQRFQKGEDGAYRFVAIGPDGVVTWRSEAVATPIAVGHRVAGGAMVFYSDGDRKLLSSSGNIRHLSTVDDARGKYPIQFDNLGRLVAHEMLPNGRVAASLFPNAAGRGTVAGVQVAAQEKQDANREAPQHAPVDVELLEDGGALVSLRRGGPIVRYDAAGKVVWETRFSGKLSGSRQLRNGNLLVAGLTRPDAEQYGLFELDAAGHVVAEYLSPRAGVGGNTVQSPRDILSGDQFRAGGSIWAESWDIAHPLVRFGFDRPRGESADTWSVENLAAQARSPLPYQRRRAAELLSQMPSTASAYTTAVSLLGDADPETQLHAVRAVGRREGKIAEAIPGLVRLLGGTENVPRSVAGALLGRSGDEGRAALLAAFADKTSPGASSRRGAAVSMLVAYFRDDKETVPTTRVALSDDDPVVREWALFQLGAVDKVGRAVVSQIIERIADTDPRVAAQACVVIGQLARTETSAAGSVAISALLKAISREEVALRAGAALRNVAKDNREVGEALLKHLDSKSHPAVYIAALDGLSAHWTKVDQKQLLMKLSAALTDNRTIEMWGGTVCVSSFAVTQVAQMGTAGHPLRKQLTELLAKEPKESPRRAIFVDAIQRVGVEP